MLQLYPGCYCSARSDAERPQNSTGPNWRLFGSFGKASQASYLLFHTVHDDGSASKTRLVVVHSGSLVHGEHCLYLRNKIRSMVSWGSFGMFWIFLEVAKVTEDLCRDFKSIGTILALSESWGCFARDCIYCLYTCMMRSKCNKASQLNNCIKWESLRF